MACSLSWKIKRHLPPNPRGSTCYQYDLSFKSVFSTTYSISCFQLAYVSFYFYDEVQIFCPVVIYFGCSRSSAFLEQPRIEPQLYIGHGHELVLKLKIIVECILSPVHQWTIDFLQMWLTLRSSAFSHSIFLHIVSKNGVVFLIRIALATVLVNPVYTELDFSL